MELQEINHYKVLGLPGGIAATRLSEKEITKAYRVKALELHPDKQLNDPNASKNFQILKSSYEILRYESSRRIFDSHIIDMYARTPKETCKQSSTEKVWFSVSWNVGDGFGDYSDERLKKLFKNFGVVKDVNPMWKKLGSTTKGAMISVIVPSNSTVLCHSLFPMLALGDPSNPLQIQPTFPL